MRKRTVNHLASTIFWYVLYFLPVICFILTTYGQQSAETSSAILSFGDFLKSFGFDYGPISHLFVRLFGDESEIGFQLFFDDGLFLFLDWFVGVYLCRLIVDFLLFLPKLARNMMCRIGGSDYE